MTPKQFAVFRKTEQSVIDGARRRIEVAEDEAMESPIPKNIRPATDSDIQEDAVIWYPKTCKGEVTFWKIVECREHAGDAWKAFTATDGSRYGLRDAFVEVDP